MQIVMREPGKTFPWLTMLLAGLMVVGFITVGPAPAAWVFDRDALATGQLWRLFSGHLVHSDVGHLTWNVGGLLVLGSLVEQALGRRYLVSGLLTGALAVGLVIWALVPELGYYCGLSGILNTVLLPALVVTWRRTGSLLIPWIGAGSLAKILVEQAAGTALFTHTAWASVPSAHLAGWLGGVVLVLLSQSTATVYGRAVRGRPADKSHDVIPKRA